MKMKSPMFQTKANLCFKDFSAENISFKMVNLKCSLKSADGQNRRRIIYPPFFGHFSGHPKMSILPFARGSFETRNAKPRKSGFLP
jgi:hypothetical protein